MPGKNQNKPLKKKAATTLITAFNKTNRTS